MTAIAPARSPFAGPTQAADRIELLDAIRGVALGGILLANLMSFFGADMLGVEARRAMPWGDAGEHVLFAINWLVEGKFYSIFSMLLGVGFSVWERRTGGGRNVTFPARQYAVNGERRSFALLRPIADISAQERIRELVLQAYAEHEESAAVAP